MDPPPSGSGLGTSASLLERARASDPDAWRRLSELYGPIVYGWARSVGLAEPDAADVVQDVFLSVFSGLERFRKERPGDRFRSWLWTIARRRICDVLRDRRAQPVGVGGSEAHRRWQDLPETPPDEETNPPGSLDAGLARRALELVRKDFAERTFQAFALTAVEGRDPASVAEEIGMSVGAVYVARSRVLKRLREELDGLL